MRKKRFLAVISAVFVALVGTVSVSSTFALTVQENTETQPYYIVVGARAYDFVKVYVDNNTNTVMWVFDRDILSLAIFNDYNYVASGMNSSLQNSNLSTTNTNGSFLIGAFIDNSKIPQSSGNIDLSSSLTWQSWLYLDANTGFGTVSSLAYTSLSTSFAYTDLPHMGKATQYWNSAINDNAKWRPCLIWHLSNSFDIDFFADYACIGAGIQLISQTYDQAYNNGYSVGYGNGFSEGVQTGSTDSTENLQIEYDRGYAQGELDYITDVLPSKEQAAYNDGFDDGEQFYETNTLPSKESAAFNDGYSKGLQEGSSGGFGALIGSVIDVPLQTFVKLLDFEVLGYNMLNFYSALLGLAVFVCIVRLFI